VEIPAIINGKEVRTGNFGNCIEPHNHQHILAQYHKVNKQEIDLAVEAAIKARIDWEEIPFYHRSVIFLKAAELLSTKYRFLLSAIYNLWWGGTYTLYSPINPYIIDEIIFIVDESDIEKPYAKKMEMPIINLLDTKCKRDLAFQ